ncbi:MAG: DNA replication and repair protein RecF [Acidimicrobiales bacterium]|nr:MAG: DNA replication and repair protein RecF [Acidimicrobiales bacterium]
MQIRTLELQNFRSYEAVALSLTDGLTAIVGENGQGKTNLLEAISWIAGMGSFRGVPDDALIRLGTDAAVVRATVLSPDGREQLIEAELPRIGRNRIQVNRQRLARARDLLGVVQVTVFSPDDLELVKGGPALRRRWIDEALVSRHPKHDATRADLERILKQRNALLRSAHGRLDTDAAFTLDVWDAKLAHTGQAVRDARETLLAEMAPGLAGAYDAVAREAAQVETIYEPSWHGDLAEALVASRDQDVRRGVSTIGPHRDEIMLRIGAAPARTHASQGEQRSLALALRLSADAVVRAAGVAEPVLLLDDVFSELDPGRAEALLDALPGGQRLLTTAAWLPPAAVPDRVLRVVDGTVTEASAGA